MDCQLQHCERGDIEEGSALEISPADWQRVIGVNLTGTFLCARRALASMRSAGYGRIVTLSSLAALRPRRLQIHYASAKAGVIAFTRCCAEAFAPVPLSGDASPGDRHRVRRWWGQRGSSAFCWSSSL